MTSDALCRDRWNAACEDHFHCLLRCKQPESIRGMKEYAITYTMSVLTMDIHTNLSLWGRRRAGRSCEMTLRLKLRSCGGLPRPRPPRAKTINTLTNTTNTSPPLSPHPLLSKTRSPTDCPPRNQRKRMRWGLQWCRIS